MPKGKKRSPGLLSHVRRGLQSALTRLTRALRARKRPPSVISPVQRFLLRISGFLVPALALSSLFFGNYSLPRYSNRWEVSPIILLLSSPYYFAVNEEDEIRIAVRNENPDAINVTLRLDGHNTVLAFVKYEESNILFAGAIQRQEQKERVVKVFFPFDFGKGYANDTLGKRPRLTLWASVNSQPDMQVAELPMTIAPIPAPRTLLNGSFSVLSAFTLWLIKEWWDVVKKRLEQQK